MKLRNLGDVPADSAIERSRDVYWEESGYAKTRIVRGDSIDQDLRIVGPAIVELDNTSVVVHPGQRVGRDGLGNLVISCESDAVTARRPEQVDAITSDSAPIPDGHVPVL